MRTAESDLFPPLRDWLEQAGYTVNAEVNGCDVVAQRGDELAVIELKLSINLDLVLQVVERQEIKAAVYAAVPPPKRVDGRWRELTRLLKRLEVGLILVHPGTGSVELLFHPIPQERKRRKARTASLLREVSGRSMNLNCGGMTRKSIMTAYREQALTALIALDLLGNSSPKALRGIGAPPKTAAILYDNHYQWFERVSHGVYGLSVAGREALAQYGVLAERIRGNLRAGARAS